MPQPQSPSKPTDGVSVTLPSEPDPKAVAQSQHETVSEPGGFANDPNDATNPNEEIERYKEKLRPTKLRP